MSLLQGIKDWLDKSDERAAKRHERTMTRLERQKAQMTLKADVEEEKARIQKNKPERNTPLFNNEPMFKDFKLGTDDETPRKL